MMWDTEIERGKNTARQNDIVRKMVANDMFCLLGMSGVSVCQLLKLLWNLTLLACVCLCQTIQAATVQGSLQMPQKSISTKGAPILLDFRIRWSKIIKKTVQTDIFTNM